MVLQKHLKNIYKYKKNELFVHSFYNTNIPKCSNKIFKPINIKMTPPAISALLLYLLPNTLPIFTPNIEITNVVIEIIMMAVIIFTFKNAKYLNMFKKAPFDK